MRRATLEYGLPKCRTTSCKHTDDWNPLLCLRHLLTHPFVGFSYNGPNCPIGHGSLMACMDVATEYIFRWADKIAKQNIKYVMSDMIITC